MSRPEHASAALRWGRAALLASVALGTGVVAHVSADGRMAGPVPILVLYAVTTACAASLLGRPATTTRIVVLLVADQTMVHGVLTAMSGHRGDPPLQRAAAAPMPAVVSAPTGTGRRDSYYDLAYAGAHPGAGPAPLAIPAPVQHLVADLSGPHAVMALAHLAAAVAVGLWLGVGERAMWAILTTLLDGTRAVRVGWESAVGVLAATAEQIRPRPAVVDARAVQRRGPPLALAG